MGVDKAKAPFYVLFYYHLLSFHSLILCSNFHDMVIDNCLKLEVSYVIPQGLSSNDITHYKTLYTLLIVSKHDLSTQTLHLYTNHYNSTSSTHTPHMVKPTMICIRQPTMHMPLTKQV